MDPNNPTPPADGGTPPADAASLLNQSGTPPAGDPPADPPAAGPHDWLPEKYRVTNEAGEIDEAASTRKLADAYRSLESKLGKGATLSAPEKPEDYKITAPMVDGKPMEGLDVDEFMKDPMFQGIAKDAHAAGIPNEHMQFFMEKWLQNAPELLQADKQLTVDEASKELSALWTDEATFKGNLSKANRATTEFSKGIAADQPGSFDRLEKKFGNDPDFVALMARIGAESKFGEDTPPGSAAAVSDVDIESLQKSEAYWKADHPDHAKVKAKVAAFYTQKFGTAPHR